MKKILPLLALAVLFANACTAQTTQTEPPLPTATIQPTFTEDPTPTTTQTITPTATASGDDEPTPLPANVLTYKNAAGEIVSVELPMYQYTNKAGEVVEIVQTPDQMACLKLLADRSQWYPAETDQAQLNEAMGLDKVLFDLLAHFDISFPPKDRRTWTQAYPHFGGYPFMTVFVTGWQDGTLAVGRDVDESYFTMFCPGPPDSFKNASTLEEETAQFKYLRELAAEHQ